MPGPLMSSWDSEADTYYFHNDCPFPPVMQINLGTRQVIIDVDSYGRVVGIEVL